MDKTLMTHDDLVASHEYLAATTLSFPGIALDQLVQNYIFMYQGKQVRINVDKLFELGVLNYDE